MSKKKTSGVAKIVLVIILSILIMTLVPTGIYCAVEHKNPAEMVSSAFSSANPELIIGKWQNETRSSAYEFYEDGTYESYFSTFSFKGDYTVKGDELTLSNPSSDSTVVYKFKVDKKTLSMSLSQEGGLDSNATQSVEYNRVDRIETKTLTDLLGDVVNSTQNDEDTTDSSEE